MKGYEDINTYIGIIRNLGIEDKVVVCLEGVADLLGMSNGGYLECIKVYTEDVDVIDDISLIKPIKKALNTKNIVNINGINCTSEVQTILDLLDNAITVDIQIILECLSYFYYTHKNSFGKLIGLMTESQKVVFNEYKEDAINYYTE